MSLFWLPSHSSISYSLLILNQSSKKDPTGDSDASDDSDEEKVGMVKNSQGMNVNANISAAAITRGERGRDSEAITIHDARRSKHRQLPQVLKIIANANSSLLSIVVVYVIEVIMNTPSLRRPHHTTSMLKQVLAGTPGSKAITAFRVTNISTKLVPLLTKRRTCPSSGKLLEPLFKFNAGCSDVADWNTRMLGLKFQQIHGMEKNEAGNIGRHDLNKESYRDDMVFLYSHRLLEGMDDDKIAKIVVNKQKNPTWSFEDL